jgi:hypothetical protein
VQVITLSFNQTGEVRHRPRPSELDVVLDMCEHVARFMQENNGGEFKAYFSRDSGTVGLYLVMTAEVYDFDLGDKLAEFVAPFIERGLLGSVTLLPASTPEELAAYFDPLKAVRVEIEHA